jgi:dienelactone hydrolase
MKSKAKLVVVFALILCIVSSLGASVFQTNFGAVEYHDLTIDTDSGHKLDALLLVPKTATENTKAPAIVVSHGWYNNREMQDLNYVEYARRGYVVLAISMYGHGDSEVIESNTWWEDENNANGLYDGVKYVSRLPYVDASRIGVTGHSNGAQACREAVMQDYEGLISAVLLVSNDAIYTEKNEEENTEHYYNMFGSRDAAIVACQYDEFFHRVDGNPPREYIHQATAQSFLYHGEDPTGLPERVADTFYSKVIDEKEAIRAIYNPAITHPWAHFSMDVVDFSVDFFDRALDAPTPLEGRNQIWPIKAFFNALGVVGFFMFVASATLALLDTKLFRSLKAEEPVEAWPALEGKAKKRYWRTNFWSAIWSIPFYFIAFIAGFVGTMILNSILPIQLQGASCVIGIWSLLCGLRTISVMRKSRKVTNREQGEKATTHKVDIIDKEERGIKIGFGKLIKSIILSLVVVVASFALVYISDAVLLTDYRLWCFATIRAFDISMHLPNILLYLPLWLMYYIPLSVSTNCYGYTKRGRKGKRGGIGWAMFFAFLGPEIMVVAQYTKFFTTGTMVLDPITGIMGIWLFPILVILPLAAYISHLIYKKTKNPYIGGIIMAIVACILTVTNTLTG